MPARRYPAPWGRYQEEDRGHSSPCWIRATSKGEKTLVVVECDGHDFHERTKEQAAKDKARDRFLTARGIKVLRFTGSEIYRDPEACWDETLNVLWNTPEAIVA